MALQLDRQTKRTVDKLINAAGQDINTALAAYNTCSFGMAHKVKLDRAHASIAKLLAWCIDGDPDQSGAIIDVSDYTLYLLETYEDMASSLQEAIARATHMRDGRDDSWEQVDSPYGLYLCVRVLTINGKPYRSSRGCYNPAFGFALLDAWEDELRRRLARGKIAA